MCDAPNANSPTENLELDEAELDPIPEQLQDMVRQIAAFVRRPETEIERILRERDGAFRLASELPVWISPDRAALLTPEQDGWALCGHYYRIQGRAHEAIAVYESLYRQMMRHQEESGERVHKGMPLVWMSDCFSAIGCPVHAKRYLLLTLCEDSIREQGRADAQGGAYFRLVWRFGLHPLLVQRYARHSWDFWREHGEKAFYPERVLMETDDEWQSEIPAVQESGMYRCSGPFARHLLARLGTNAGRSLEMLAQYVVGTIPGCRAYRRRRSRSTDYDVVGLFEGPALDFRSELGRLFVCECKDWSTPADFSTVAKFCRVLDSAKSRFGILFSRDGITGARSGNDAERERFKVFSDRGIVIVVVTRSEIETVAEGANFVSMLRLKYEQVRLDLRPDRDTGV
jgi:hypothetical protein